MALASASAGDFAGESLRRASNMISPIWNEIGASVGFVFGGSLDCASCSFFIDDLAINKDIRSPIELDPNMERPIAEEERNTLDASSPIEEQLNLASD